MKFLNRSTAEKSRSFDLNDGSKIWGKMLTVSEVEKIRIDVGTEAGTDSFRAESLFKVKYLQKALTGWEGFEDEVGTSIPFSVDIIPDLCEVNPVNMGTLFSLLSSEFFHISQAERKNSKSGAGDGQPVPRAVQTAEKSTK